MREKKTMVAFAVAVLISGTIIWIVSDFHNRETAPTVITQTSATERSEDELQQTKETFPVVLSGAVSHPGIYEIDEPLYLYEFLDTAGGVADHAAISYLNQVFLVDRPMTIYIPSQADMLQQDDNQLMSRGIVPLLDADVAPDDTDNGYQKININRANISELSSLPGIGEVTAKNIVEHREQYGDFRSIEDIMQVSGIKQGRFEAIKDLICV